MRKSGFLVGAAATALLGALCTTPARADRATECTAIDICYCVEADFKPAIDANVAKIRMLLAEQRSAGKAIGYMSIPLSTAGGSYFGVNAEVAAKTKARVEKRFGEKAIYLLNPGNADFSLPAKANGADYMLQWTRVLEGRGLGEDFDFFYFTGPTDFAGALGLTGEADMEKIDSIFDQPSRTRSRFSMTGGRWCRPPMSSRSRPAMWAAASTDAGSSAVNLKFLSFRREFS